jgi:hypothetical protein
MGNSKSKKSSLNKIIGDHFDSYSDLEKALRNAGLESSQLIVGVDFTKSNTWQGRGCFEFENLHTISNIPNPYQQVLSVMCSALAPFDDDQLIDAYGFGDKTTTNKGIFPFQTVNMNGAFTEYPCVKLEGVLESYNRLVPHLEMSGPTSFAPIIRKAIELVSIRKAYHILLIIADGCVDDMQETIKSIVEASYHPLSIICIGVGKGPWDKMKKMDDDIPQRKFDNFQFVNFNEIMKECENIPIEFARNALMEIPMQYHYIKNHLL